jgi:threonine dehydratase
VVRGEPADIAARRRALPCHPWTTQTSRRRRALRDRRPRLHPPHALWKLPGAALGVDCAEVWLKLEHLQVAGSFKARGMYNRLLANPFPSGVIVASGGNAGIATAAAARALGVRCEVFVPTVSSPAKQAKLRELGAEVVVTGAVYAEALEACLARQQQTGALLTHAYDQPEVVAGAGTLAHGDRGAGRRAAGQRAGERGRRRA